MRLPRARLRRRTLREALASDSPERSSSQTSNLFFSDALLWEGRVVVIPLFKVLQFDVLAKFW